MFSFFRKKEPPPVVVNDGGVSDDDALKLIWVRKRMPDPGAENYAFETLDLPLFTPIGAGVAVRKPMIPTQYGAQPYFPQQQVSVSGFGQVSGGIVSQPLYNPQYAGYGGVSPLRMNDPFPRAEILPAGRLTL